METRPFVPEDLGQVLELMREEGDEWADYYDAPAVFEATFAECPTWVAVDGGSVRGFVRCREDGPYGVFVYDLLVSPHHRGRGTGKALLDAVVAFAGTRTVYILSDADGYYAKLGYRVAGTIFETGGEEPPATSGDAASL